MATAHWAAFLGRKMRKVLFKLLFLFFLFPISSQEYSYKVYTETGINEILIKNGSYKEKSILKYQEKLPPYMHVFSEGDRIIAYDKITASNEDKTILYELDINKKQFKELYRVELYNPEIKTMVSVKDYIFCIEYDPSENKYFLTKRNFSSPEIIEKIILEIQKEKTPQTSINNAFFYNEYLIINYSDYGNKTFYIVSTNNGKEIYSGNGKLLLINGPAPLCSIENKKELYKFNISDNKIEKQKIKISISDKEEIYSIKYCGEFCLLYIQEWKKTDFFTSIVFGVTKQPVYTEYICTLKENEIVDRKKLKK